MVRLILMALKPNDRFWSLQLSGFTGGEVRNAYMNMTKRPLKATQVLAGAAPSIFLKELRLPKTLLSFR